MWLTIGWLFAWRWCLLGWVYIIGFPLAAKWAAPSMLRGAFDVTPRGMFFVCLTVFFLCYSLRLLGTVAVAYGPRRTGLPRPRWVKWLRDPSAGWPGYFWWTVPGFLIIWQCIEVSANRTLQGDEANQLQAAPYEPVPLAELGSVDWVEASWLILAAVSGLAFALILFLIVLYLHRRGLDVPASKDCEFVGPMPLDPPLYHAPSSPSILAALFKRAGEAKPWPWFTSLTGGFGSAVRWTFGPQGYYHPVTKMLWSGYRLYILMVLALIGLYVTVYFLPVFGIEVPVLVYLTILVLVGVWVFNALAFALDRYRIPVLLPLFLFVFSSQFMPWTQYRFNSVPDPKAAVRTEEDVPGPAELLGSDPSGSPVVVAAEGGGIHSGAWTTHVLRTIETEYRAQSLRSGGGDSFAKHIICVSGVSGGSYGLMYWVDSYQRPGGPDDANYHPDTTRELTEDRAMRSSLSASIRSLVYHDIWRSFLPIFPQGTMDRGSILEQEWETPPVLTRGLDYPNPLKGIAMHDWRMDAKNGKRPAVLFNCMNADNGQPVVFTTTRLGDPKEVPPWEYHRQRPGERVNVVTAVRCSASFPFVCPAASPSGDEGGSMHLVDGGYYDNFGVASLNRWLALAAKYWEGNPNAKRPPRLLVVQVRASSESLFPQIQSPEWKGKGHTGFLYQASVPIVGLINMRSAAQTWHNDQEYSQIVRRLEALGIKVRTAVFRFPGMDNALSWHLTTSQQQAVRSVHFLPPQDRPARYTLNRKPATRAEKKLWSEWTRHEAQWALHSAWNQVGEHFVPARSLVNRFLGFIKDQVKASAGEE